MFIKLILPAVNITVVFHGEFFCSKEDFHLLIFNVIYLLKHGFMDILILWVIQYHHLFIAKIIPFFSYWELFHTGFSALLTCPHPFLNTSLVSDIRRCFRIILYSPHPSPEINHFSKEIVVCFKDYISYNVKYLWHSLTKLRYSENWVGQEIHIIHHNCQEYIKFYIWLQRNIKHCISLLQLLQ